MLAFFLSHWEIVVILLVALLLFGTRLPKVARSLGQGVSEFKDGLKGMKDELQAGDVLPKTDAFRPHDTHMDRKAASRPIEDDHLKHTFAATRRQYAHTGSREVDYRTYVGV